jgi:hypothetical protein
MRNGIDIGGTPGRMYWVGNCPELTLGLEVDQLEHRESYSGQSITDLILDIGKSTTLSFILEDFKRQNLAMALRGDSGELAAQTITNKIVWDMNQATVSTNNIRGVTPAVAATSTTAAVPSGTINTPPTALTLYKGDILDLGDPNVLGKAGDTTNNPLTLSLGPADGSGTKTPLIERVDKNTANAQFSVDRFSGTVEILSDIVISSVDYALFATYATGVQAYVAMFDKPSYEYFLRFAGLNTADSGNEWVVDLFKVQLNPLSELSMIGDELSQMTIEGAALMDDTKPDDNILGQFGAIYPYNPV